MSKKPRIPIIGSEFNITDYVDAAGDAAGRTRAIAIVLVISCVLIFIGFLNSFHASWPTERIRAAFDGKNLGIFNMLKAEPYFPTTKEKDDYRNRLREEVVRAYVDNVRFIKLPFFGIAIDVNDLGVIGGMGLFMIMLVMRFSLSREVKNLNVSFREAFYAEKLKQFYHALAMRQVFTVPEMLGERRNRWLAIAPKIVCILPPAVLTLGIGYDHYSIIWHNIYGYFEVIYLMIFETIILIPAIWWISLVCLERQFHIDEIWDDFWKIICTGKTSEVLLDESTTKTSEINSILDKRLTIYQEDGWLVARLRQHIQNYWAGTYDRDNLAQE